MEHSDNTGGGDFIDIKMLGGFSIGIGGHSIQDSSMRTHQLWHLIQYLIAFRNETVLQNDIIHALWPSDNIDNPANALKNLVYRIRSTFSSHKIPYAKEMIIYQRGGYQWNNSLRCTVDTEQFEALYKQASDETLPEETRMGYYMQAVDIYAGDFLPGSAYEAWVVPLSAHYRGIYFKCVYSALALLESRGRFEEMEEICKKALVIDKFEESTHRYLLLSYINQGKQQQALSHYGFMSDLFFRELGVSPSTAIRDLYRDIVKTMHDVVIDIGALKEDLNESGETGGAFYCEYEVFKNLYRLEARTAARTGQSIFISLLTIELDKGVSFDLKNQAKAMDNLYEIVEASLRKGDVFARFSASQYVLMLSNLTYENCEMVMARIVKKYRQAYRLRGTSLHAKIHPLDPVETVK